MTNAEFIPDPQPPLAHDHSLKGHVEEPDTTFRPGWVVIDPDNHDGTRFTDAATGELHQIVDIEADPEDPEGALGTLVSSGNQEKESRRVKFNRRIQESRPFKYAFIDHKKGVEVTAAAVTVSAVAVTSLIVRRRKKHQE